MPPKKNKTPNNTPQIKKPKGRPRKLQSPASIKIEIPVQQTLYTSPRRTRKSKIALERKIELANEVLQTQLPRKVQIQHVPNTTETEPTPAFDYTAVVENNVNDGRVEVIIRKVTRKGATTNTEPITKPTTTRKRAADSTQQVSKRRKVTVKELVPPKPKNENKQTAKPKGNVGKKRTRGKKKIAGDVCNMKNCPPILDNPVEPVQEVVETVAAGIASRKTSSASNLSWTKDISSSSTTTCVTVSTNDFVRIDKKLPMLQLKNVDSEVHKYKRSEINDSTSDSESSSSSESDTCDDLINVPSIDLKLSTSSLSSLKTNVIITPKRDSMKGDVNSVLGIVSSVLKSVDIEIMKWIGYIENVDDSSKRCNEKLLNVLNEENNLVSCCRQIKSIMSDKGTDEVDKTDTQLIANFNSSFDDDNPITKDNVLLNENVEYPHSPKSPSTTYDSDYGLDHFNYVPFERNNDDDDALSLFAESITGIEPSRTNDSCNSPGPVDVNEEYIPLPVNKNASGTSEKYRYSPTKIAETDGAVKRNVCEKQNADSTSIYKDVDRIADYPGDAEECSNEVPNNVIEDGELSEEMPNQIGPPPVTSIFQKIPWKKTNVFRNICFYNIMNICRNNRGCNYQHIIPTPVDMKMRLVRLSESMFIEEYIFLSSWPILRRKYGFCFVEECHRRGLPRILVEIAIDVVLNVKPKTTDDANFQMTVLEYILLGLNDVGLVICEDLLNYQLDGNIRLCDVFIRVIATSQNFSRFKHVFLNLTKFMVHHQRTFSLDVAEQILERVCILPAEENLLRAVFDIITNTNSCIFNNSMMCQFESRLRTVNSGWHEEFVTFKNGLSGTSFKVFPSASPIKGKDLEPLIVNCINDDDKERYTSPDTTKGDILQNKSTEPTITRTVNFTKTCHSNSTPKKNNNWMSNNFSNWRHKSPVSPVHLMRPMRPQNGRMVTNYRIPNTIYRPRPPRNF